MVKKNGVKEKWFYLQFISSITKFSSNVWSIICVNLIIVSANSIITKSFASSLTTSTSF
jgi:hypothetical protein